MPEKQNHFLEISGGLTPKIIRLGLSLAIFLYGGFGILDFFTMPENYSTAWIIRFGIIIPALILVYILSYQKWFHKQPKVFLFLLLSAGQLGIIAMIILSSPLDPAFHSYYAGLILVILWASFVFQLNFITSTYISISTIVFFNLAVLYRTPLANFTHSGLDLTYLIANNFFLVSAAILTSIGAYLLDKKDHAIQKTYKALLDEKDALEIAKEKAEESDRLKSQFLNNLSHEIRTPMNGIIGFMSLLNTPNLDEDSREEYMKIINQSGNRLMATINDIIELSKIEAKQHRVHTHVIHVQNFFDYHYHFFAKLTREKDIQFKIELAEIDQNLYIKSDKIKLDAILSILINNAIKFTPKGSVEVHASIDHQELKIEVKDSGIGIPNEKMEAIFKPFTQVDGSLTRDHEGAGLGLTLCKAHVEKLGGKITVQSQVGQGSQFTVIIPCEIVPKQEHTVRKLFKGNKDLQLAGTKIMLVEDDEANLIYLKSLLKPYDFILVEARNGEEALRSYRANMDCRLILMDIKMPVMNGLEATREIRKFDQRVPIIAQTAHAFTSDREEVLLHGCDAYISKPYRGNELIEILKNYLA
jgi:signal transduction histidine kinase/CheY-like chemotaxis protein